VAINCKPIQLNPGLHARGERVELPREVTRELAWWVASELVRRHPGRLRAVEAHPISIYDCVSIIDMKQRPGPAAWLAHLNLEGHITTVQRGELADPDNRFNWYEVLKADNPREYVVKQIEGSVGLRRINKTPRTVERTIGPRCIARFAQLAAASNETWEIRAGFGFDSDDAPYRAELFRAFPNIPTHELRAGDVPDASRFWFVVAPDETPMVAIDTENGLGWSEGGGPIPLLWVYRTEARSLDRVLGHILPPQIGLELRDPETNAPAIEETKNLRGRRDQQL
jgi:hypothetical protein